MLKKAACHLPAGSSVVLTGTGSGTLSLNPSLGVALGALGFLPSLVFSLKTDLVCLFLWLGAAAGAGRNVSVDSSAEVHVGWRDASLVRMGEVDVRGLRVEGVALNLTRLVRLLECENDCCGQDSDGTETVLGDSVGDVVFLEESPGPNFVAANGSVVLSQSAFPELFASVGLVPVLQWDRPHNPSSVSFKGATWSPEVHLFLAVGYGYGSPDNTLLSDVMISSDGVHWSLPMISLPTAHHSRWTAVTWARSPGKFVAVGFDSSVMCSEDGVHWTEPSVPDGSHWLDVIWAHEVSLVVAVGQKWGSVGDGRVLTSSDGVSWSSHNVGIPGLENVAWSPELHMFVAVSHIDGGNFAVSSDGFSWQVRSLPVSEEGWWDVDWSPKLGLFVAVSDGNTFVVSSNGLSWQAVALSDQGILTTTWKAVLWVPERELFVASSDGGKVVISSDGLTWSNANAFNGLTKELVWAPDLELLFVVGGSTLAISKVMPQYDESVDFLVPEVEPPAQELKSFMRALP